ncbi:hypothetical protein [Motilibacter aurantiacus]|uniref:hypothetical protein n=1 Tax=Motilibacter aurantiacus TaxID=2714955 RepID=UPI0014093F28|nr:hypothetical protein [Motilibacter aurantiacus]NHC44843.1 hypothetical protein [Motilibacter aurantiacus]
MTSALRRAGSVTLAAGGLLLSPLSVSSALADPDYGVAPAAPLVHNQTVSSSFTLWFTDNSDNEDGFRLETSLSHGASWAPVEGAWRSAMAGTGSQATLRSSSAKLGQYFRVVAHNGAGATPSSTKICC